MKLKNYMKLEKRKQKVGKFYPYLSFRFFCHAAKDYIHDYKYSGKVDELFESDHNLLIPEQCTGLKDKKKRWVFEGDILEFELQNIDPSLLKVLDIIKEKKKSKINKKFPKTASNKKFQATVDRDPCEPTNLVLEIVSASGLTALLPISHAKKGEIIGNRFQTKNPKKSTKKFHKPSLQKPKQVRD